MRVINAIVLSAKEMTYNPEKAYNNLSLLPPKAQVESAVVLKKVIAASRALSELKGAITNLPNPTLFIDTIHLQEAQASSAVENIITTQDELFKAHIAERNVEDAATKEVLHYKEALWYGLNQLEKKPVLTTNLFISLAQIVTENESGIRNIPGTQLRNPITKKVVYTPPSGAAVIREKLKNLEKFINSDGHLDPLVKLAIIHYQFEAIHPFFDGNGRTGRIILLLYLKLTGLLDIPALYLSNYIISHKTEYYKNLRNVTKHGKWEAWIMYMLDMIEQTSIKGRRQILSIEKLMKDTGAQIQKKLTKVYSKELLEVLFHLPYTKRAFLVEAGLGNAKTAGTYLAELERAGFLRSEQVGKEKLYLNHKLMDVLKK